MLTLLLTEDLMNNATISENNFVIFFPLNSLHRYFCFLGAGDD
jgi:hypothetical protein